MATVIYVPKDTRAAAMGRGLGSAYGGYVEKQDEDKRRKELAQWVQQTQASGTREEALSAPMPAAFKGAQGALQYSSLIETIHPRKAQEYVLPTSESRDPKTLESVGRFMAGQQPKGAIALDVAKVLYRAPAVGKGGRDTPARLKTQVLRKQIANDAAIAQGKPPPYKLTRTENRIVESEKANPTLQAAIKIAIESTAFQKLHKSPDRQWVFIKKIMKQLDSDGPLSDIMSMPPGISDADIKAIMENPNQAGKSQEQIIKELWDGYNNDGKRY